MKSEKGEPLGTHNSKKEAQAQLAAIEANKNEEQLSEITTMQGGGIAVAPGTTDEKPLTELFSTSVGQGIVRVRIVSGEREHEGHVKKARYQGLKNVMENDTLPE